jgi:hypothetical protein
MALPPAHHSEPQTVTSSAAGSSGIAIPSSITTGTLTYVSDPVEDGLVAAVPTAIVCITILVVLLRFANPLSGWIRRWHGVETPWGKINTQPSQDDEPPPPPEPPINPPNAGADHAADPNAAANEEAAQAGRLARLEADNQRLKLAAWYERIYGAIFGSQLIFLLTLNVDGTRDEESTKPFYTASAAAGNHQTFEQWLEFPTKAQLIEIVGNPMLQLGPLGARHFAITAIGRSFVDFVVANQRTTNKPY